MSQAESNMHAIAAARFRLAVILTVIMLVAYFGFILLVAFNKALLSILLTQGLSVGILLGALVIVCAWILSLIYVNWANNHYDRVVAEAVSSATQAGRK